MLKRPGSSKVSRKCGSIICVGSGGSRIDLYWISNSRFGGRKTVHGKRRKECDSAEDGEYQGRFIRFVSSKSVVLNLTSDTGP